MKANDKYSPRIDKTLTANEKNIANLFSNIFTSIAQKLGKKPPKLICHCDSRFQREWDDIDNVIVLFKKANAHDQKVFWWKCLKHLKSSCQCPWLHDFISLSLETGFSEENCKSDSYD